MKKRAARGEALRFFEELIKSQTDDCIVWPYARNCSGYGVFGKRRGEIKSSLVSRVVCLTVHGMPVPPRDEAAHTCGNVHNGCVNPRHLDWKTSKQNKADQLVHGTRNRGERNGQSTLKEEEIRQIKVLAKTMSQSDVAVRFRIDQSHVSNIVNGKSWRHIITIENTC
jgi:hypothetical protein